MSGVRISDGSPKEADIPKGMSASFCNPGDSCDGQPETPHKNREMILVGRRFTERFAKAKRRVQEFESRMDHHKFPKGFGGRRGNNSFITRKDFFFPGYVLNRLLNL